MKLTRKQIKAKAAQYLKFVEWSEEDGVFIGRCIGLFFGGVHGKDEAAVYKDLCQVVEEWIEILSEEGKPLPEPTGGAKFSGNFMVRMDPALHRRVVAKAELEGESLDQFVVKALATA